MIIRVKCGWCQKYFHTDNKTLKDGGYGITTCSNCGRVVNSSNKQSTGNVVGRKHIHFPLKDGDVV